MKADAISQRMWVRRTLGERCHEKAPAERTVQSFSTMDGVRTMRDRGVR